MEKNSCTGSSGKVTLWISVGSIFAVQNRSSQAWFTYACGMPATVPLCLYLPPKYWQSWAQVNFPGLPLMQLWHWRQSANKCSHNLRFKATTGIVVASTSQAYMWTVNQASRTRPARGRMGRGGKYPGSGVLRGPQKSRSGVTLYQGAPGSKFSKAPLPSRSAKGTSWAPYMHEFSRGPGLAHPENFWI